MISGDATLGVGLFDYMTLYKAPASINNPTYQVSANLLPGTSLTIAKTNGLRLQEAFDALPTSGGTVALPSGRFYISQTNSMEAYSHVQYGDISAPLVSARRINNNLTRQFTGWVGFRFTVGNTPLDVTHLGRWIVSGNSGSHELRLYKVVSGTLTWVASATLNTAGQSPDQSAYVALSSEVRLDANTTCYLFSKEVQNGDYWVTLYDSEIALKANASGAIGAWSADPITQGSIVAAGLSDHCFGPVNLKFQAFSAGTLQNHAALLKKSNVTIQGNGSGTTLVAFNRPRITLRMDWSG
ncbi:MAG TPA: hypothetical protein P5186_24135 [Candidatus Paceibacterota bacterium]|nr:hypothetical protein [Candidatus Paceibacterota bacterium]